MNIEPSKPRTSLKQQRRVAKPVSQVLSLPELDQVPIPTFPALFSVEHNHQDSERLFHQVWKAIQSTRSFECTLLNHEKMKIDFFFSPQQPFTMLVQSLYTQEVTKQMIDKFLIDIKSSTLTDVDDQQHCNIRVHCQKIIGHGVIGLGPI